MFCHNKLAVFLTFLCVSIFYSCRHWGPAMLLKIASLKHFPLLRPPQPPFSVTTTLTSVAIHWWLGLSITSVNEWGGTIYGFTATSVVCRVVRSMLSRFFLSVLTGWRSTIGFLSAVFVYIFSQSQLISFRLTTPRVLARLNWTNWTQRPQRFHRVNVYDLVSHNATLVGAQTLDTARRKISRQCLVSLLFDLDITSIWWFL